MGFLGSARHEAGNLFFCCWCFAPDRTRSAGGTFHKGGSIFFRGSEGGKIESWKME